MRRRTFIRGSAAIGTAGVMSVAGCMDGSNEESIEETEEEQNTIQRNGEQYFFQDTTGTMGQLGEGSAPSEAQDWQVIQNELTEDDWQEKQTNDIERVRRERNLARQSANDGIEQTLEEMLQRVEEIYKNQQFNTWDGLIDIENEDDEITFTRSLIKASQEAGVDSSGLADDIVSNMAEYAEQELDFVDFDNYKLSTLPATETIELHRGPDSHDGAPRRGFMNSGFSHFPALLQYSKDGETEVKYTEMTKATLPNKFRDAVRDPEDSKYRASLDQDTMKNGEFPEHFVTALDYSKARELELRNEDILGFGPSDGPVDNDYESLGDEIGQFLTELVDDYHLSGIMGQSPDMNKGDDVQIGSTLVSDELANHWNNMS